MADDVKKLWKDRDRVVRAITKDGQFRAALIRSTNLARSAEQRHELEPLRSLVLARALTGASLMASFLKGEERVAISFEGDGPVSFIYAEAIQVGEVRGYAKLNTKPVAEHSSALGGGLVKVQRVLYNKFEPVTGIVELKRGDVTSDLSYYLTQSEQIPSAFVIDVAYDEQDRIRQAAGLLMQAMPGARPEDIFRVYDTIDYLGSLTQFIDDGYSLEEIMHNVMPSESDITASTPVDFFCRCSIDRFKNALLTLGFDEVDQMHKAGHNELVCQYCNERYYLAESDFAELKEQLIARSN